MEYRKQLLDELERQRINAEFCFIASLALINIDWRNIPVNSVIVHVNEVQDFRNKRLVSKAHFFGLTDEGIPIYCANGRSVATIPDHADYKKMDGLCLAEFALPLDVWHRLVSDFDVYCDARRSKNGGQ